MTGDVITRGLPVADLDWGLFILLALPGVFYLVCLAATILDQRRPPSGDLPDAPWVDRDGELRR